MSTAEPVGQAADDPIEVELPTLADTHRFGARLAQQLRPGDLIVLAGPLGAGKTALTQGIGKGLGSAQPVVSPTFVIARVHDDGRIPLVHVDAYRLGSVGEVDELDLDVSQEESVTVVEWGAGIAEQLSEDFLSIELSRDADSEARRATLRWRGGDWAARLSGIAS
jgi:tRNA threonylcarbamoyladenosine biosynthesis protein TsaE